jgi:hypothetical protein
MKKVIVIVLAAAMMIFATAWPGQEDQVAFAARGHGGGGHRGGHGGGHFSVWLGPGWGWDPFFYPYYPSYPYYPYYSQPPVVIQQQPQEYVMPEPQRQETNYWYFCKEAKGYYPYIKKCPGGWMKVVPAPAPPDQED